MKIPPFWQGVLGSVTAALTIYYIQTHFMKVSTQPRITMRPVEDEPKRGIIWKET